MSVQRKRKITKPILVEEKPKKLINQYLIAIGGGLLCAILAMIVITLLQAAKK